MAMIVYKNGSLTREYVRNHYADGDWGEFNRLVELHSSRVPQSNQIGFYFLEAEITPKAKGIYKFEDEKLVEEFGDPTYNPLALLQSQFLSMRLHARKIGYDDVGPGRRIIVTGGASQNDAIVRILAVVFGATVVRSMSGSAALGAAYRARYGGLRENGWEGSFEESLDGIDENEASEWKADERRFEAFTEMLQAYRHLEARVCEIGSF